jgi:putative membrane protein
MTAPALPSLLVGHWQAAWPLDAEALAVALLYAWATRRLRGGWPIARTVSFITGILCVLVALQSGIGAYDDRLLSVHMVQHMLLLLLAPLLVLGGDPATLILRALPARSRSAGAAVLKRARRLTGPLVCLAAFDVVVVGTHLPWFYDATLRHPLLHDAEHLLYVLAGLLLWWPIVRPDPVVSRRLGGLGRLFYMLASMPAMALVGAYLNRQPTLVYPAYGPPARALGVSAVADQAQAGAIMWVAGSVLMTAVGIWAALAALAAEERRQQRADARLAGRGGAG